MITNMTRIEQLLSDPNPDISLDELKAELNELAKLRDNSRIAFCKRLSIVYLQIVGRPMSNKEPHDGKPKAFYEWCWKNIRTANSKQYSTGTLKRYLMVGFSARPAETLRAIRKQASDRCENMRKLGIGLEQAVRREEPPKVIPITKLKSKYRMPTDVAREVNALMTAWEQASTEARSQFIYMVTGKRVAS